jgi:hypothetical protein
MHNTFHKMSEKRPCPRFTRDPADRYFPKVKVERGSCTKSLGPVRRTLMHVSLGIKFRPLVQRHVGSTHVWFVDPVTLHGRNESQVT